MQQAHTSYSVGARAHLRSRARALIIIPRFNNSVASCSHALPRRGAGIEKVLAQLAAMDTKMDAMQTDKDATKFTSFSSSGQPTAGKPQPLRKEKDGITTVDKAPTTTDAVLQAELVHERAKMNSRLAAKTRSYTLEDVNVAFRQQKRTLRFFSNGGQAGSKGEPIGLFLCATNGWEGSVTAAMGDVFTSPGAHAENELMLDIGSNSGFYSVLGAAYDFKVYTFDLQIDCLHMVKSTTAKYGDLVTYNQVALSSEYGHVSSSSGSTTRPTHAHEGCVGLPEWRDTMPRREGAQQLS